VVRLPADVELEDRLAFGLTGKQLALLAGAAVAAYACFLLLEPLLPTPLAAALPLLVAAGGGLLALARHDGLSGDQLALALARFALTPRRQLLAPEGLPARLPGAPRAPRLAPLDIPIRRVLASGLVELADGSHCRLFVASGTSFELRSPDEQHAFVTAFARFLNALGDAVQIVVQSEPASLAPQADRLARAAEASTVMLRAAALDHARFLRSLAGIRPLYRRRILLVLRSRERRREPAQAALARLATAATELLLGADVALHPLEGDQAARLLAASLDPPGPLEGSQLQGEIHAHPQPHQQLEDGTGDSGR
jgi:PrgI family protein